jgi:UDP-MurNAc hydroxylase
MLIKFYGNSFLEIRTGAGKRIVCDPWILDGAYYGSWFHYPPVRVSEEFYAGIDYLYFSHLHPDHFDPRSLRPFDRRIPVLISERRNPTLLRALTGIGFRDVTAFPVGLEHRLDGFRIRLWNDFGGQDVARQDSVGFELDSSIAVFDGGTMVLDVNDNVIEETLARALHREYPKIDCALLPYAGAGPYPQLFENLGEAEKLQARAAVRKRYLDNFLKVARILQADVTVPCAGEYVVGGKNWEYTRYVHTPTPRELAEAWREAGLATRMTMMSSHDVLEVPGGELRSAGLGGRDYGHEDRIAFARSTQGVPYLIDGFVIPEELRLPTPKVLSALNKARATLGEAQRRYGSFPPLALVVDVPGTGLFAADLRGAEGPFEPVERSPDGPFLRVTLPYPYLFALLTQHVHWNNLEIGNHVRLFRSPERYVPDVHVLLSFFHF